MKALIVDDETDERTVLRQLCEADASIAQVAVADSGAEAIEIIRAQPPDLLFLDVELQDMTGFEVLRSLEGVGRPAVVMVAAHENHAFEAFRSGAIDYLTKPVGAQCVTTAIQKAHRRQRRAQSAMLLTAEHSHRLYFIAVEDIDYIESCGNYVLLHAADRKFVRRDTLKRLATELKDLGFEWISRSIVLNLSRVAYAEKLGRGALAYTLHTGARLASKSGIKL